jgi:hypothetical protein
MMDIAPKIGREPAYDLIKEAIKGAKLAANETGRKVAVHLRKHAERRRSVEISVGTCPRQKRL